MNQTNNTVSPIGSDALVLPLPGFTPGPWITSTGRVPNLGRCLGVLKENHKPGEKGESICVVCKEDNMEAHDIANADLIAAAPVLLECLIHLADRDWFQSGMTGEIVCQLDAEKVRNALSKALGQNAESIRAGVDSEPT